MSDLRTRLETALDQYRIESQVGEGGMAVVFLAEDLKHHRRPEVAGRGPDPPTISGITSADGASPVTLTGVGSSMNADHEAIADDTVSIWLARFACDPHLVRAPASQTLRHWHGLDDLVSAAFLGKQFDRGRLGGSLELCIGTS